MSAGSPTVSLTLLALACAVLVLLHCLRAGGNARVRNWWLGAGLCLAMLLPITNSLVQTASTYPKAENHRLVVAAAQRLASEAPTADCVVVVEGSSVFAHAVNAKVLREELVKAGRKPCLVMLSLPGADHFERECMAEDLRAQMSPDLCKRVDALPLLWVTELHWNYEAWPARFLVRDQDTDCVMSQCDPVRSARMVKAIWRNWKAARNDKSLDEEDERAEARGLDRMVAAIHLGLFNAFHGGQLQRQLELPVEPLTQVLSEKDLLEVPPDTPKEFWAKRPPIIDEADVALGRYRPRKWFNPLVESIPSGWPKRAESKAVLVQAPSQSGQEMRYGAALELQGNIAGVPLILASRDLELRRQLDDIHYWRDGVHMEQPAAELFTRWLASKLLPHLAPETKASRH